MSSNHSRIDFPESIFPSTFINIHIKIPPLTPLDLAWPHSTSLDPLPTTPQNLEAQNSQQQLDYSLLNRQFNDTNDNAKYHSGVGTTNPIVLRPQCYYVMLLCNIIMW